jgi:DNA-binding CsgD family transcriptional regulator
MRARLTSRQLNELNRAVLAIHRSIGYTVSWERIIDAIEALLPVCSISIDEADQYGALTHRAGRRLETIPQLDERIARFCYENPVVAYTLRCKFAPVLKVSDFKSFKALQQTAFYREIASYMPGWRDQAAVAVRLPQSTVGIGLNRDRSFSSDELFMLQLLQPHIEYVLRRADPYNPWRSAAPLTAREREVLQWVAEGKRDAEIATLLGISVRTVEHHVHLCLQKLGVETRVAACAEVWRARNAVQ